MIDLIYFVLSYLPKVHFNFQLKETHIHYEVKTLNASVSASIEDKLEVLYQLHSSLDTANFRQI